MSKRHTVKLLLAITLLFLGSIAFASRSSLTSAVEVACGEGEHLDDVGDCVPDENPENGPDAGQADECTIPDSGITSEGCGYDFAIECQEERQWNCQYNGEAYVRNAQGDCTCYDSSATGDPDDEWEPEEPTFGANNIPISEEGECPQSTDDLPGGGETDLARSRVLGAVLGDEDCNDENNMQQVSNDLAPTSLQAAPTGGGDDCSNDPCRGESCDPGGDKNNGIAICGGSKCVGNYCGTGNEDYCVKNLVVDRVMVVAVAVVVNVLV